MKNKWITFLFCLINLCVNNASSQSIHGFDIIPELDGKYLQAQGFIISAQENGIIFIGDLLDTTLETGDVVIRPFLERLDYSGNSLGSFIIHDSVSNSRFSISTRPIIVDSNTVIVYIDRENNTGGYNATMLRVDINTGKILQSRVYPHPPTADSTHVGQWYYRDTNKNIIAYHYLSGDKKIFIRKIDSIFNQIEGFLVASNGRRNVPRYIEALSDSTYILVGVSRAPIVEDFSESKPFYMKVDLLGNIIDFKLVPDINHKTVSFSSANSYTVLKRNDGSWIISVVITEPNEKCSLCYDDIPLSFAVSSQFDSLLWRNYFSDVPYDSTQYYYISSSDFANDNTGFVVAGYDFALNERNSFLTKISMDGTRLWTRHYVPVGWEPERISWADMEDVKSTPHNTYVLGGTVFDNFSGTRKPWVLHVDSLGCLVPGCDVTVFTEEIEEIKKQKFTLAPSPIGDQLYLLANGNFEINSKYSIHLLTIKGEIIRSTIFYPEEKMQYIFSVSDLVPGEYFIQITNEVNESIQVTPIIKL